MTTSPGEIIRAARTKAGVSQAELARRIGYTNQSSVSQIERGVIGLDMETAVRIADALGTARGEFLEELAGAVA